MSIQYLSLDSDVRTSMVSELDRDLESGALYTSPRLNPGGVAQWPQLLREAFESHDDAWLAEQLRVNASMNSHEPRKKPKGGITMAKVPITAPDTLAEGEFNRFYARGLCLDVLASGGTQVRVYRGKPVERPRAESEQMIGRQVSASDLLEDLRTSQGVEPCLGLPPGPNSGLSVCRLEA